MTNEYLLMLINCSGVDADAERGYFELKTSTELKNGSHVSYLWNVRQARRS